MATEEVGVRLSVKGRREAARALADTAKDIDRLGDRADRNRARLSRFGGVLRSAAKGVAIGAAAGVAAFGVAVAGGVKSLLRIEQITAQTNAVIKSTGGVANVTADSMIKLGSGIEKLTGIEQESIQEGQNLLLTFTKIRNEAGKGNDIFTQATESLVDMSVALGMDMSSSAMLLGKALNDPVKGIAALTRSGVTFTEQQKDQVKAMVEAGDTLGAQKMILKELETQFGASAEAFGQTNAGKIERFKHAVGGLQEQIALFLMPAINGLTGFMVDRAVPALERFGHEFEHGTGLGGRFRDKLDELRAMGVRLWEEFRTGTGTGGDLRGALETAGEAAVILGTAARDYVLPPLKWLGENPNVLAGVVGGMVALSAATKAAATWQVALNTAQALGFGAGGKAAAAGGVAGAAGKAGRAARFVKGAGVIGLGVTAATTLYGADPKGATQQGAATGGLPKANGPDSLGQSTAGNLFPGIRPQSMPSPRDSAPIQRQSIPDLNVFIDGQPVLTTVEERAHAREARR